MQLLWHLVTIWGSIGNSVDCNTSAHKYYEKVGLLATSNADDNGSTFFSTSLRSNWLFAHFKLLFVHKLKNMWKTRKTTNNNITTLPFACLEYLLCLEHYFLGTYVIELAQHYAVRAYVTLSELLLIQHNYRTRLCITSLAKAKRHPWRSAPPRKMLPPLLWKSNIPVSVPFTRAIWTVFWTIWIQ